MQEISLVFQEFARLNGLRAPNYPLNIFVPIQTHLMKGMMMRRRSQIARTRGMRRTCRELSTIMRHHSNHYIQCQKGLLFESRLDTYIWWVRAPTKYMAWENGKHQWKGGVLLTLMIGMKIDLNFYCSYKDFINFFGVDF